jgi:hypothetical protein
VIAGWLPKDLRVLGQRTTLAHYFMTFIFDGQ